MCTDNGRDNAHPNICYPHLNNSRWIHKMVLSFHRRWLQHPCSYRHSSRRPGTCQPVTLSFGITLSAMRSAQCSQREEQELRVANAISLWNGKELNALYFR